MNLTKSLVICSIVMLSIGIVSGYSLNQLANSNSSNPTQSWEEPPLLTRNITNRQQALNELENLGCTVIEDVYSFGTHGNWIDIQNYSEFRRIAYNTKIVLFKKNIETGDTFVYTILDGILVSYKP